MKNIPLFVPTFDVEACLAEVRACLEVGWTGLGFKTVEFEQAFGRYLGQKHCHFLNSNTNGIHLILEMLKRTRGWSNGDEVISTPLTFVSANHSILHAGLKPVFADVDDSLCINANSIEKVLTPKTRAVLYVGIGGNSSDIKAVVKLCRERDVIFIFDAAHSAGSRLDGEHLSNYADYAIYSFQAVKNLPTGDAGLIVVNSAEEDVLIRRLSWCGINKDTYSRSRDGYKWLYDVDEVGFKYHGNSIMAGIALAQLGHLDNENGCRRRIASAYSEQLRDLEAVSYIAHANECESSRHLVQFYAERRDELIEFLGNRGIGTGVHYLPNTCYPMYADQVCPRSQELAKKIITLPIHLRLSDDDVDYVSNAIREFYRY